MSRDWPTDKNYIKMTVLLNLTQVHLYQISNQTTQDKDTEPQLQINPQVLKMKLKKKTHLLSVFYFVFYKWTGLAFVIIIITVLIITVIGYTSHIICITIINVK